MHARQWAWDVTYPQHDIELTDEIHIPVDTPIDIHVTSADVIHGFWVPRLGGKIDDPKHEHRALQADEVVSSVANAPNIAAFHACILKSLLFC